MCTAPVPVAEVRLATTEKRKSVRIKPKESIIVDKSERKGH